jgi:hypothetical protein
MQALERFALQFVKLRLKFTGYNHDGLLRPAVVMQLRDSFNDSSCR